jgi:hypothetical protein
MVPMRIMTGAVFQMSKSAVMKWCIVPSFREVNAARAR